jgi:hypothetical protein
MAGQIFTNRLTDITYQYILPVLIDGVSNSNVFTSRMLSNTKDWEGVTYNVPVQTAFSPTGGSFNGMDQFSTASTNNTRQATFYITGQYQSIVIPGIEAAVNSGTDSQVIKLMTAKADEARISSADAIGTEFYSFGLGKDFDGLGNIVDNGTNAPTYGGLTRSQYPFLVADVTSVANNTITLDYLGSEFDNSSAASSTSESPTMGLAPKNIWTFIEGLLMPMVSARYEALAVRGYNRVDGKTPMGTSVPEGDTSLSGSAGFISLTFRGRPIVADDKATAQTFFWINEKYLAFHTQKSAELREISSTVESMEGFYEDVPFPSAFQFRDMMSSINQLGQVGVLILLGNLIDKQPRRNGKLIAITGN